MTTPRRSGAKALPIVTRKPNAWSRSCGKCGNWYMRTAGSRKHPAYGWMCPTCSAPKP